MCKSSLLGNREISPVTAYEGAPHRENVAQAGYQKDSIERRFAVRRLELNPQKTRKAYCKDANRRGTYPIVQFDFLGYSFQPRLVKSKAGEFFIGFNPAISLTSAKAIRQAMRSWRFHRHSDLTLEEIARKGNPVLRGWLAY